MVTGPYVTEKNHVDPVVWKVGNYVGSTITLSEQVMGHDSTQISVSVEQLLDQYRLHKGQVTALLPQWSFWTNPCSPLNSSVFKLEVAKAAVFMAMKEVFEELNPRTEFMELLVKPNMVKVTKAFEIGEFALAPASTRIDKKEQNSALCCGKFDLGSDQPEPLYITPMFVAPVDATGKPNKHPWVCVMWHVPGSQKGVRPNLAAKCCPRMIGSVEVKIPILINIKPLEVADELPWDKASAKTLMAQRSEITTKEIMQSFQTANKKLKV